MPRDQHGNQTLFDHRLFLSATPHNGHSNSFSTLLSLLDRQRFTQGVKVDPRALEQIMVRRLKSDLRALKEAEGFPEREVVALSLATKDAPEVVLAAMLADYTRLAAPKSGRARLVFENLQKRLLSSVAAFRHTLEVHAHSLGDGLAATEPQAIDDDDDVDDSVRDAAESAADAVRSRALTPSDEARAVLDRMRELAAAHADEPDAKLNALLAWIRTHQCPAAAIPKAKKGQLAWTDRRVIVFTEYGHTKNYLRAQLERALGHTDDGADRVMEFHGGMSDAQRDLVQRAFNGSPAEHAVRILVATDAAREGLNLQAHCADLFHYDIPWNPARMEQRNGRIDRALQPAKTVRCHYFVYEHRREDRVFAALLGSGGKPGKLARIQRELGSLATVVLDDIERILSRGIDEGTLEALEGATADEIRIAVVSDELEQHRDRSRIERDIADNKKIVAASAKSIDFDPDLLCETIDVGLALAGAGGLEPATDVRDGAWRLPTLAEAWQRTLDTVRPPRERDEDFWEWRAHSPLPVVFTAPDVMTEDVAHLHLSHPVTQRVLSRFLAQGFSARDLSRVTAMRADVSRLAVLALGRLSLFGTGAARLHDELIAIGAHWDEDKRGSKLRPLDDKQSAALRAALEVCLHARAPHQLSRAIEKVIVEGATDDFAALWPAIEEEAEAEEHRARQMLTARARVEAEAMRGLLANQERAIRAELDKRRQVELPLDPRERAAHEADTRAMDRRLGEIVGERETEPAKIEAQYVVALPRLSPVGLV